MPSTFTSVRDQIMAEMMTQYTTTASGFDTAWATEYPREKPKDMQTIKKETIKIIKAVLKSKRESRTEEILIPTDSNVYKFHLRKNKPTQRFVICPEDYFEVSGFVEIQNKQMIDLAQELWELGDPSKTQFNYEDGQLQLRIPEKLMTKTMMIVVKDVAMLIKDATKTTISVVLRDDREEQRQYKEEREKIKTKIKQEQPEIEKSELRNAIDREIQGWSTQIFKPIMEV